MKKREKLDMGKTKDVANLRKNPTNAMQETFLLFQQLYLDKNSFTQLLIHFKNKIISEFH
jgi:hypothetical protein